MIAADENPEILAERLHRLMEALLPLYKYATPEWLTVPFHELPLHNQRLLITVCRILLSDDNSREAGYVMELPR